MRLALGAAILLAAVPARGGWTSPDRVITNTAYTLEESELIIGILSPLQYGVTEDVTIALHPILALLLTPNVSARVRLWQEEVTVSVAASYSQTFLRRVGFEEHAAGDSATPYVRPGDTESIESGFPGSVQMGVLVSVGVGAETTFTPYAGYTVDFFTQVDDGLVTHLSTHGPVAGLGFNWLIGEEDLLTVQVQALWSVPDERPEVPTGTVAWVHAWDELRLGIGVAAGRFPLRIGEGVAGEVVEIPIYPYLDLWWRR
ncbi:MAG: hypothetical protein AMXMBFR64_29180 [Myxococcales bacterium]